MQSMQTGSQSAHLKLAHLACCRAAFFHPAVVEQATLDILAAQESIQTYAKAVGAVL